MMLAVALVGVSAKIIKIVCFSLIYSIVLDCSSIILRPKLALCCCKYLIMSACLSNNSSRSSPSLKEKER